MGLSSEPRRIWIEVLILYVVAIAAIGLFKVFSFVPFIAENLWGIAGIIFLFLPVEYLYRKRSTLVWLSAGDYRIGSEAACSILVQPPSPGLLGSLVVDESRVRFAAGPGVEAVCVGEPVVERELRSDGGGKRTPDRIRVGDLVFWIVERGRRLGVRLVDEGVDLAAFGLTWKYLGRGLLWAAILIAIGFPPYILAYKWWFGVDGFHFALPATFWQEIVGNLFPVALPEEAFYRGYMQTRLDSVFKGRVRILGAEVGWALVVASALFAVGHLVEFRPDKLGTFFPGLVFGWMRAKTGSIGGAVVFHAACNIWAQVLRYGYFGVP